MATLYGADFSKTLDDFEKLTNDLSHFVSKNLAKSEAFQQIIHSLYSMIPNDKVYHKALRSIIIEGFDEEQIWAQLELENEPFIDTLNKSLIEIEKINSNQNLSKLKDQGQAKPRKTKSQNMFVDDDEDENDDYEDYKFDDNDKSLDDFDYNLESDSKDSAENAFGLSTKEAKQIKSKFELEQGKTRKLIKKLEDQNVSEKPWQLLGEVTADKRPENSLLEEYLQYDFVSKPPPNITEEVTTSIEDIIKQRIKEKIWDDVERKVKPGQQTFEYKKRNELDSNKSKLGLAKIYEQEYLKKQENVVSKEESKEEKEVKKLLKILFVQLNALSAI